MMRDKNDKFRKLLQESCPQPLHEQDFHDRALLRIEHLKKLAPPRKKRSWKQRLMEVVQSPLPVALLCLILILYFLENLQDSFFNLYPQLEQFSWLLLPFYGICCMATLCFYLKELQQD